MGFDREVEPPEGWERTPIRGNEIGFRRRTGDVVLSATKTTLSKSDSEWELEIEHEAGSSTVVEPFGRVSDREAAIGALRSCAKAIDMTFPEEGEDAPDQLTASSIGLDEIVRSR